MCSVLLTGEPRADRLTNNILATLCSHLGRIDPIADSLNFEVLNQWQVAGL